MVHAKEPSLLHGHDCRAKVKICCFLPEMLTSPFQWKIIEWDENPQANKQQNKLCLIVCISQSNYSFVGYVLFVCLFTSFIWLNDIFTHIACCSYFMRFEIQQKLGANCQLYLAKFVDINNIARNQTCQKSVYSTRLSPIWKHRHWKLWMIILFTLTCIFTFSFFNG